MWSISSHPSIPSSVSSLLWLQKLAHTTSAIITNPLPIYETDRHMKTMATAVTFYV